MHLHASGEVVISFGAHEMKHPHYSSVGTKIRNLTQPQNRAALKGLEIIHVLVISPQLSFFLKKKTV